MVDTLSCSSKKNHPRRQRISLSKDVDPAAIGRLREAILIAPPPRVQPRCAGEPAAFPGGYTWNDTRYDRLTQLDLAIHDARAVCCGSSATTQAANWIYGNLPRSLLSRTFRAVRPIFSRHDSLFNAGPICYAALAAADRSQRTEAVEQDPLRQVNDVNTLNTDVALSYVTLGQ